MKMVIIHTRNNMIKKGQILKYKNNNESSRKVLEIVGELYFLSDTNHKYPSQAPYIIEEIEEYFEIPKERWVPKHNEEYFFINTITGIANTYNTNNYNDVEHVKIGNIFKTKEEAQKMADKFKELLKQNV